jgi:chromatin remodeling complex protein RSC6
MEQAKIDAIQSVADAINRLADAVMGMSVAPTEPTPNATAPATASVAAPATAPARKRTEAAVKISEALANFIGVSALEPMTRQEATSEVMKYVKAHNLQAQGDRRKIEPDEALAALVGSSDVINVLNLKSSLRDHFTAVQDAA